MAPLITLRPPPLLRLSLQSNLGDVIAPINGGLERRSLSTIDFEKLCELLENSKIYRCLLGNNLENKQWTISSQALPNLKWVGFVA